MWNHETRYTPEFYAPLENVPMPLWRWLLSVEFSLTLDVSFGGEGRRAFHVGIHPFVWNKPSYGYGRVYVGPFWLGEV